VTRLALSALIASLALTVLVLELVRRRRIQERYSLLWLGICALLVVFAVWADALGLLARTLGIAFASNALFVLAGGFFLVILMHFSMVISRLVAQVERLAQRVALLEERVHRMPGPEDER
jgi:hypothetical protein